MKRSLLAAVAAVALLAPATLATAQDSNQQSGAMTMQVSSAEEFMMMAAMSDMFEIQSSQLALEEAQSDEVKEFAQMMITDHTANTQKLMQIVEAGGGSMEPPKELDGRHEAMLEKLQGASGESFDAAYIDAQVMAHQEAVALMSSYAENGDNESLKEFASEALPVVQSHLEMVQKMDQGSM